MKRLLIALALVAFVGSDALAQSARLFETTVFRVLTPTHRLPYDNTARELTGSLLPNTSVARIVCTTDCFLGFTVSGGSVNAAAASVTSGIFLPAGVAEYFQVSRNGKISAVRSTSNGIVYITEMGR